ncbi:MAG TPA: YihY/virulence factor BrkB family protein [Polyangiaceae bacterium]|nr:YihY/virulence factor BrkB family protein [Polyangiaceae bacterium]
MNKRVAGARRLILRLLRGLTAHGAFRSAAAVAFWAFLSIVPLLVMVGFLVGQVARRKGVDELLEPLLEVIPTISEDIVRGQLERLGGGAGAPLAPLGVIGYLWTASSGLHNLMDLFETIAAAKPRAYWKQRVMALGWVVLGLATACVLAWILVRLDFVLGAPERPEHAHVAFAESASGVAPAPSPGAHGPDRGHTPPHARPISSSAPGAARPRARKAAPSPIVTLLAALSLSAAGTALLASFYRFAVERPPRRRRYVLPGTIAAVTSWLVVSWGFGTYVASTTDYALYYGSLAAVAVLLVWLYLTSLALIVGAEVNALFEDDRAPQRSLR